MSYDVFDERSVVLRLEFSIADAVKHRGIGAVLSAAVSAWWAQRPRRYSEVPPSLRDDVGLTEADPPNYLGVGIHHFWVQLPGGRVP